MDYSKHASTRATPQRERALGRTDEVENSEGGFVFAVNDWVRLERFLILGSEGGTFYIGERKLTRENAEAVARCIKEDGLRVINTVVEISDAGRAHKNDQALFVLAMIMKLGATEEVRAAANKAMPKVARTGTHLFQLAQFIEAFGGWGSGTRRAFSRWYSNLSNDRLAAQLLKYQSRNGWSHRDILRLAHPIARDPVKAAMFDYTAHAKDAPEKLGEHTLGMLPRLYDGFRQANDPAFSGDKAALIAAYNLSWEMLPSEWLSDEKVSKVLLAKMLLMALIRQLGRLTANGTLKPLTKEVPLVVRHLTDEETIKRSRIHPMHYLLALTTYQSGHGVKGNLTWEPIPQIVSALNEGFYKAFVNVEPTGKAFLLGVDVSSSMRSTISGTHISAAQAAAAMAMVIARTESNYYVHGFTCGRGGYRRYRNGDTDGFVDLKITANDMLGDAFRKVQQSNFGGTDCAVPMLWAQAKGVYVDCFVVLTDNETWAGNVKPYQALAEYRRKVNQKAKLVVVGMTSNGFTIADPQDAGMLDVVGFDAAVPSVIADFAR